MVKVKSILYQKDINWVSFFNIKLKCKFFDKILPLVTFIGSAAICVSICLLMIGLGKTSNRHIGFEALVALTVSHLVVQALKRSVCRIRPKDILPKINTFNVSLDLYSFPSGHTTAVFSIATTLALYSHVLTFLLFPIALIVGISRLYIGVHYPSDVIAGIFIAVVISTMIHLII
jgi:undecaprenyl-diphosphatase